MSEKKDDVCRVLTPEILRSVIGRDFSRPVLDRHPDRFTTQPIQR